MYKLKEELKKFGARLRELRKERKMTQEQLAEKIGMFDKYYSNIERGIRNISFKNILKIAEGFNLELKELFDYKDEYRLDANREEKIKAIVNLLKRLKNDSDLDFVYQMIRLIVEHQK